MGAPVICPSCGTTLSIPADYARSKLQCTCGVYCSVPADAPRRPAAVASARSLPEPAPATPIEAQPAPGGPLLAGTDEDDGRPYTVPGDPVDPASARKKAKPTRSLTPLTKSWENGWPLQTRIQAFIALIALNVLALLFSAIFFDSLAGGFVMALVATGLMAFLVGTFDRIGLSRNSKGQVRLTQTWRIAFIERNAEAISWSQYESVSTCKTYQPHIEDWIVMLVLVPYGLIPAVLWWWFVIRPERYHTILFKDHGFPETVLFRTQHEGLACEVAEKVAEVTGLPRKQDLEEASGGSMSGR